MTVTKCEVSESDSELQIHAVREESFGVKVLSGPVTAIVSVLIIGYYCLPHSWLPVELLVAAVYSSLMMLRKTSANLRVTKLEFRSIGRFKGEIRRERITCMADILSLEYHDRVDGGTDFPDDPGGLYAIVRGGNPCLLPYVSEEQTLEIIKRIEQKFPLHANEWHNYSPFDKSFTTLKLTGPK